MGKAITNASDFDEEKYYICVRPEMDRDTNSLQAVINEDAEKPKINAEYKEMDDETEEDDYLESEQPCDQIDENIRVLTTPTSISIESETTPALQVAGFTRDKTRRPTKPTSQNIKTTAKLSTTTLTKPPVMTQRPQSDNEVLSSVDPFYLPPQGEQMTCDNAGVSCPENCSYVDWSKFYNRTMRSSPINSFVFSPQEGATCFQRCTENPSCVSFSFNSMNGSCNLYDVLKLEYILKDPAWSLHFRNYDPVTVLREWIVTRDLRPRENIVHTEENVKAWPNCLNLCASPKYQASCNAAVFEPQTSKCSLYVTSESDDMIVEKQLVTIQHISLFSEVSYRFDYVGPVSPDKLPSVYNFTSGSVDACLEDCSSSTYCQVATTVTFPSGSVDCRIFNDTELTWIYDNSVIANSFFLKIPKNNSLYRALPQNIIPKGDPVTVIDNAMLDSCHMQALEIRNCFWYTFDSESKKCTMFNQRVVLEQNINATNINLMSFFKTTSNDSIHYSFENLWVADLLFAGNNSDDEEESTADSTKGCLGRCMNSSNCFAAAVDRTNSNCHLLSSEDFNKTVSANETYPSTLKYQVYKKSVDLSFLTEEKRFKCQENVSVDWNVANKFILEENLENYRNDNIPLGNNAPLEPHGSNFSGQETPTKRIATHEINNYQTVPTNRAFEFIVQIVKQTYWQTLLKSGLLPYFGAGTLLTALYWAPEIIGLAQSGYNWISSWFTPPTVPPGNLEEDCLKGPISRSEELNAESSYKNFSLLISKSEDNTRAGGYRFCKKQPDVINTAGKLLYDKNLDVTPPQEDCRNKAVNDVCHICCRVGYVAQENATCLMSGCGGKWHPKKSRCIPREKCGDDTTINGYNVLAIPVVNCHNEIYYGSFFQKTRKIPLFTVYRFDLQKSTKNYDRGTASFAAFGCKEVKEYQLDDALYKRLNALDEFETGVPSVRQWDKGHLTGNADIRDTRDASQSTFLYINAAPQDHQANIQWGNLETQVRNFLSQPYDGGIRGGYVITGVCTANQGIYLVFSVFIPSCFWKLVCTRTDDGRFTVAAFFHQNLPSKNSTHRDARIEEIFTIRDQRDPSVDSSVIGFDITQTWMQSKVFFPEFNTDLPVVNDLIACYSASNLQSPLTTSTTRRPRPRPRADESTDLYYFWYKNILEGYVPNYEEKREAPLSSSRAPPACGKKVVGYVTGWSDVQFTDAAASYLTHTIFAFIQIKGDGSLAVGSADPDHSQDINVDTKKSYLRLYEIKKVKANSGNRLKTMFAVGGWENSQYFSFVAGNAGATKNFIQSAISILDYFDMDGIDIDWEYPVTGGAHEGVTADRANYITFLSRIRNALNAHQFAKGRSSPYFLTIAGAAGAWVLEPGFDLEGITSIVDWINVMTYDYYGAWDSQWGAYTGPHAPLYFGAPKKYSGKTNVDYTLKYYSCRIKNPQKLVMGLGFYGRFWNHSGSAVDEDPLWRKAVPNAEGKFDGGFEPWHNIQKSYLSNEAFQRFYNDKTKTPYLMNGDFLLAYEDPNSIQTKVRYAAAKNFAGIMIWAVDLDDNQLTMIRAASTEALCGGGESNSEYKCPPIQEKRWWTLQDGDGKNAGMCGRTAPLYNGYYPVCDPEDPGFACCSDKGYCGSGDGFCNCDGCADYYNDPNKILEEPIKPSGPVRWHTSDQLSGNGDPQCGYPGFRLANGEIAICNPDDKNAPCCSSSGYCGKTSDNCECDECVDFRKNKNFVYPKQTWIVSGPHRGMCGYNPDLGESDKIDGNLPTCSKISEKYGCCSKSGYCGSGSDFCSCDGCVDFRRNPDYVYPRKTWIDSGPDQGKCGRINGEEVTCNPHSGKYYCCSSRTSGYCGSGPEYCDCSDCVNYKK